MSVSGQQSIDQRNANFWDELCGTTLARSLGIADLSRWSLQRFDEAYLEFYPYLLKHVQPTRMRNRRVLEVGLGFGTIGHRIAEEGAEYTGMDIALNPVKMMNHRLELLSLHGEVIQGSFLENDLVSDSFDYVVSIGCYHHTGSVPKCVSETYRVLKPGGMCVIMVYNRFSLRQWLRWPLRTVLGLLGRSSSASEKQRGAYDADAAGSAAPTTEFSSVKDLKTLFRNFSSVSFKRENFDDIKIRGVRLLPRRVLLSGFGPLFGLDIYIEARK